MDYQMLRNARGEWCLVVDRVSQAPPALASLEVGFGGLTLAPDDARHVLPPLAEASLARLLRDLGPNGGDLLVIEMDEAAVAMTYRARLAIAGAAA